MAEKRRLAASFLKTGGIFVFLTDKNEAVKAKIRACILGIKGELPTQEGVGSEVIKIAFSLMEQDRRSMISVLLRQDLARNVPEITVISISVDDDENNRNAIIIKVNYQYRGKTLDVSQGVQRIGAA